MIVDAKQRADIAAAMDHLQRGDLAGAKAQLAELERRYPQNLELKLHRALAHRLSGEFSTAVQVLDQALSADPYFFLALLSKGEILKQMGKERLAAEIFANALKIAPTEGQIPSSLKAPIARARETVDAVSVELEAYLRDAIAGIDRFSSGDTSARIEETIGILAGTKRIYNAEPIQLHIPRLPAIPFFDREYFPWLEALEANTGTIRDELVALLELDLPGFAPYIDYPPGTPENQYKELNGSELWSALWLWRDGEPQLEPQRLCPQTTEVLSSIPMADQQDFAPTAVFSALAPNTRIPPHTGSTNARLLVHLPLVLPGPAGFRVGNETREWRLGEAWVFDDSIQHEAWNNADETRVILIFDVWNPLLNEAEKEMIRVLLRANYAWSTQEG
ncbi:aspartyl beta-hydroxylase [Halioglobus sp. HI00S01]|uniref:aspartyl/asparaginyl beta-hydroxylase domain-containing protein n=1 Tax=Halioglobus sp. HI00S01 TaxID=1822214 RepID=UPI0007C25DF8|nr:aspartyl/asparaginyl beta-hydroxylase domain-containing protein [Halioglobus sp. HI00S01]KZX58202.1 aspartyl beta-hydroxylase [Halioglobus sp. HI00S01]